MTLVELITEFRRLIDDHQQGDEAAFIVSDEGLHAKNAECVRWANEAVREYRRRVPLFDATTTAICQIAVVAGTADYTYDTRIFHIHRAMLLSQVNALASKTIAHDMDDGVFAWLSSTDTGTPTHFLLDKDTGKLRLYPIPDVNDTLTLGVWRLPLTDMAWATRTIDTPEVPSRDHQHLLYWMANLFYQKQDADTYDPKLREYYYMLFNREVGMRLDDKKEQEYLHTQKADMTVRAM